MGNGVFFWGFFHNERPHLVKDQQQFYADLVKTHNIVTQVFTLYGYKYAVRADSK